MLTKEKEGTASKMGFAVKQVPQKDKPTKTVSLAVSKIYATGSIIL